MTSVCVTRVPRGHYRFWHVARMEWIKLRALRSTWWTMGIGVAGAVAIGVAVGRGTKNASGDLTNNALAGMVPGLLLAGVLGVLVMTSEYSSGTIRATLAAIPGRRGSRRVRFVLRRRSDAAAWHAGASARPARCAARGAAVRDKLLPDRPARPWTGRHHPPFPGRDRRAGRRGICLGAGDRRGRARREGIYADTDRREFHQYDQARVLRGACRAVPAAPAGVDRARHALPVCRRGPGGRRVAARPS